MMSDCWLLIKSIIIVVFFISFHIKKCDLQNQSTTPVKFWPRGWFYTKDPSYIKFLLYPNPENEDYFEEILIDDIISFKKSKFDINKPLIILLHGYLGHSNILTDVQLIKNAYLSIRQNSNIIIVDYRPLAAFHIPILIEWFNDGLKIPDTNYNIVGTRVAKFLNFLKDIGGISNMNNVHIIGFSLGCYVAGTVGNIISYEMNHFNNTQINRITGLDCPFISIYQNVLNKNVATFVDITHTSIGLGGIFGGVGHVDFFMNGAGFFQPNCYNAILITDPYCAHASSAFYFSKSIRNKYIFGCKCDSYWCGKKPKECNTPVRYGHFINTTIRGTYYVEIPGGVQSMNHV